MKVNSESKSMEEKFCKWCERKFVERVTGGSPKRFCSATCRNALHSAARRYVDGKIACGELEIADLKERA